MVSHRRTEVFQQTHDGICTQPHSCTDRVYGVVKHKFMTIQSVAMTTLLQKCIHIVNNVVRMNDWTKIKYNKLIIVV